MNSLHLPMFITATPVWNATTANVVDHSLVVT